MQNDTSCMPTLVKPIATQNIACTLHLVYNWWSDDNKMKWWIDIIQPLKCRRCVRNEMFQTEPEVCIVSRIFKKLSAAQQNIFLVRGRHRLSNPDANFNFVSFLFFIFFFFFFYFGWNNLMVYSNFVHHRKSTETKQKNELNRTDCLIVFVLLLFTN